MKITINIKTDNAAFKEHDDELYMCLHNAIRAIAIRGNKEGSFHDTNGNKVGSYKVTGK